MPKPEFEEFKAAVEMLRPNMQGLGMTQHLQKLEAAILLEDLDRGVEIFVDSMRHLKGLLVSQINQIDAILAEAEKGKGD